MALNLQTKRQSSGMGRKRKFQLSETIFLDEMQHAALIDYIKVRLDFGKTMHDNKVNRFEAIAKEVAGFMVLDKEDKQRQDDNAKGYGPKVYDVNIPLAATQMDEAVTFFTTVFFPEEGPYNAVTTAEKVEAAKGFSRLMNQHSDFYGHFTNFGLGAYCGLKYNLGLWIIDWQRTKGSVIQNGTAGTIAEIKDNEVVMMGNEFRFANPYNTILDPSVHPCNLHKDGEFFAEVEIKTTFQALIMQQRGEIYNLEYIMDPMTNQLHGNFEAQYYTPMPEIFGDTRLRSDSSQTNWVNFLSGYNNSATINGLEFVTVHVWLPSKQLGLGDSEMYQIWRLTIANMVVVAAELMTNAHGFLPLVATVPWADEFGPEANSFAEMLLPYQRFSSFQMNVHQRASRKALYNLIVYNSRLIPAMAEADSLGGKVPMDSAAEDMDINRLLKVISDTPDTTNTLQDISAMDELMQKILPTDILKQVASLERATQYQAAATVQGANRRNLKIAKTIDSQAFSPGKKMQMYNILQFQEQVEILGEGGETTVIDPGELRELNMEFAIADGLRGLDKLILIETMKDILALLVQNPQAAAEFNIADLIDYITTLIGDHTSFTQFRFQNEFDKLTPEQKQMAFQLLQRAMQAQAQQQGAPTEQGGQV